MAPNFRPNTQTRRGNRGGYVEHDDFEGLPVRQWRQEWVNIAPPPPPDTTQKNDIWAVELLHGMPKDSHLLPTHTQELLRAARSGRLYKRPAPAEEDEADADAALADKPDKKEDDPSTKGFQVRVWKQIARNAEGPAISHLAKRRKEIITLSSDLPAGAASGPTVTKATVRRVDAAGNPYTQEITLNEGQLIDGEIISTTVVPAPSAITNAEGSTVATPVRRRPPPPKRKPKGPGRGRRKKLPLPASTRPENPTPGHSGGATDGIKQDHAETNDVKPGEPHSAKNLDVEMADDDEGDDGDDDVEEGEDGDEGDEDEGEDATTSRADSETKREPTSDVAPLGDRSGNTVQAGTTTEVTTKQETQSKDDPSPTPNPSLVVAEPPPHMTPSHFEGSPLKNVVAAQSPPAAPETMIAPASEEPQVPVEPTRVSAIDTPMVSSEPVPTPIEVVETSAPVAHTQSISQDAIMDTVIDVVDTDMPDAAPARFAPIVAEIEKAAAEIGTPSTAVKEKRQSPVEQGDEQPQLVNQLSVIKPREAREDGEAPKVQVELPPLVATVETAAINEPALIEPTTSSVPQTKGSQAVEETESLATSDLQLEAAIQATSVSVPLMEKSPSGPAPLDTKVEADIAPPGEEKEPDSPDLFSGLEAALNQHGGPKDVPDVGALATQETKRSTPPPPTLSPSQEG
ncbi:hypothetical protein F4778DRAFT_754726 [Xylariomycetidae sp. FL2044]|nr:hypothetical protein F4778DRAFT_754726 [Xylariomycetidae sp. FL2044]